VPATTRHSSRSGQAQRTSLTHANDKAYTGESNLRVWTLDLAMRMSMLSRAVVVPLERERLTSVIDEGLSQSAATRGSRSAAAAYAVDMGARGSAAGAPAPAAIESVSRRLHHAVVLAE
jgi:hypothetical protein